MTLRGGLGTLSSHRLRLDLDELMTRIWNSEWINPYAAFVRSLVVVLDGSSVDTFGVARARPLAKGSLPIRYFQESERGVHDIRDLPLEKLTSDAP